MLATVSLLMLLAISMAPLVIYYMIGLGRTVTAGPCTKEMLPRALLVHLRLSYGVAVLAAVGWGMGATPARYMFLLEVLAGIAVAWPVSYVWARYRLRRAEYMPGGPDPSVPDEQLFPSDRLARSLWEGRVRPLPPWVDIIALVGCELVGVLIGTAFAHTVG